MFVKDRDTNVIINTDDSEYNFIVAKRRTENIAKSLEDKIQDLDQQKSTLDTMISKLEKVLGEKWQEV